MPCTVGTVGRSCSGSLLRKQFLGAGRSHSLPELQLGGVRGLNVMLLHPRAPKIRHLNASHSLLIEMEKHVRKVQELEHKVHELEMQLQLRELASTHKVLEQAWKSQQPPQQLERADAAAQAVTEEQQLAFQERLARARSRAEQLVEKRKEEEATVLKSWHQRRLELAITHLSQVPETEPQKLLPQPQADPQNTENILQGLEALVDTANPSLQEEVTKLRQLLEERDNLKKLLEDIEAKEAQTIKTIEDCQNTLYNVNAARVKLNANLKMSKNLLTRMQNMEKQKRVHNMFVFGPNPIFSNAKEQELSYSISNAFVIEMLKELDISYLVAEKNLNSAKECRAKYKENRNQIDESMALVKDTIEMQIVKVNEFKENSLAEEKVELEAAHEDSKYELTEKEDIDEPPIKTEM